MFRLDTQAKQQELSGSEKSFLEGILRNGGPAKKDFQNFTNLVNQLPDDQVEAFRDVIKDALDENTLIGHGFVKPFGYPGDFMLINKIYTGYINPDPKFSNWDSFFQDQAGAHAVRNRKKYFLKQCSLLEKSNKARLKVLILGSGPATDVCEYLTNNPGSRIEFDLIDFDQNAINYSNMQNSKFNGSVRYYRINVLRYKPVRMYDRIWSAGLFDYFKDKHFAYMINKYYKFLSKEGEFIIGNFSNTNPTRRLMEVLSDWHLNHRSKNDLINTALDAGIKDDNIMVDMESLGVNLFLHLRSGEK